MTKAVTIGMLLTVSACASTGTRAECANSTARVAPSAERAVSLGVRAIELPGERSPHRMALEVTLSNGLGAEPIWVMHAMAWLDIDVRNRSGTRLAEGCAVRPPALEDTDYALLGGGEAVVRIVPLNCYDLPDWARVTVTYQNQEPAPAIPSLEFFPLFRGPVSAEPVVVTH